VFQRPSYPLSAGDYENQIEGDENHQHGGGSIEAAANERLIDDVGHHRVIGGYRQQLEKLFFKLDFTYTRVPGIVNIIDDGAMRMFK
jgi:hypothetical protein